MGKIHGLIDIDYFDQKKVNDSLEKELMALETECFPAEIRKDWEGKRSLMRNSGILVLARSVDDIIIGECYTNDAWPDEPEDASKDAKHFKEVFAAMQENNGTYLYSLAVLPIFQGLYVGRRMVEKLCDKARALGKGWVYGHFKQGASAHIAEQLGGQFMEERTDWYGTGNTHILYRIKL